MKIKEDSNLIWDRVMNVYYLIRVEKDTKFPHFWVEVEPMKRKTKK